MSILAVLLSRALAVVAPVALAVWAVGALDAVGILARGGAWATLAPVHVLLVAVGIAAGLLAWPVLEALNGLGAAVAALSRRLGRGEIPASRWPAAALGAAMAWRLVPAHDEFTIHAAGTWLMSAYALVPCVLAAVWVDRARRRMTGGRLWIRLAVALAGVGLAVALHAVNSRLLIGLYQPLHRALSEATLWIAGGTFAVVWAGVSWRPRLAGIAVLGLTALSVAPVAAPGPARSGVWFLGTELRHLAEAVEPTFDADDDGIPRAPYGGDCDDSDPAVHPLAFERPGNQRDDNCRLGDRPVGQRAPERAAPVPPGLAAWRAAHPTPNVVLIFIDTWRWDHLSPTLTPNLWALAARSTRFTQARTTAPRTPLAWMSLLRGRFLGRCLRCRQRLAPPGKDTLVHRLSRRGYQTYGRFVGKSWARYYGIGGFDRERQADSVQRVHGDRVVADVRRWLRALQTDPSPFFLMGHFADPHAPYLPNDLFTEGAGHQRGDYANEVRFTDHHVGRLLKDLNRFGRMEDTIVVVFADHGENLGEHGDAGGHHGVSLFDEVLRVPLLVYVPGVAPSRVDAPVSLADLAPTLLSLTGSTALNDTDGRSLAGYFFGAPPPEAPTISEFYDFGHRLRAVVLGRYKLIEDAHHDVRLLFDVVADPHESRDLLATRPDVAATLQAHLDAWVESGADAAELAPARCEGLVPRPPDALEDRKAKGKKAAEKKKRRARAGK